jgi:hypothetical protein
MNAPYDILRKDALGIPIWVEAVADLEEATFRVKELAQRSPGEYIVFSQKTSQIVAGHTSLWKSARSSSEARRQSSPQRR